MTPNPCGRPSRQPFEEENRKAKEFLEAASKPHQELQRQRQRWAGSTLIRGCLWVKQGRVGLIPHLEKLSLGCTN